MPCSLRLFNGGGNTSLSSDSSDVSRLLYSLAIRAVYDFGIRLHGMCEVTPYMEATTAYAFRGISLIYHTLQCYITFISRRGAFDLYPYTYILDLHNY